MNKIIKYIRCGNECGENKQRHRKGLTRNMTTDQGAASERARHEDTSEGKTTQTEGNLGGGMESAKVSGEVGGWSQIGTRSERKWVDHCESLGFDSELAGNQL